MMRRLSGYRFELLLDFHTAGNCIYYADYDCSAAFRNRCKTLATKFSNASGYRIALYQGSAGCCNYARHVAGIPAFTVEMIPYVSNPIDCSIFYTEIWNRIDTMPALAMELLLAGY